MVYSLPYKQACTVVVLEFVGSTVTAQNEDYLVLPCKALRVVDP